MDEPADREEITERLTEVRAGWREVAASVLRDICELPREYRMPRELVLNLKSVTEQLEREQRAADEAALKAASQPPAVLPEPPAADADPLAGLTLYRDDEEAA